ncbi:MAG: dephospho-CoA kinase [Candidatus Competibacteraceae bacterium]
MSLLVVALTGGIGSGKTAVSEAFARHGVPVIDTDILAREVVEPGRPALQEIVEVFGEACLNAAGSLDRTYLRRVIFADAGRRQELEAILHPRILRALRERLATLQVPYCLVAVPLLVETGLDKQFERILLVDVPEKVQIERVMARDRVDAEQARRILSQQASRAQRLAVADEVIENTGTLAELEDKVTVLHQQYLALAIGRKCAFQHD